jgi:hypothetical protein
MCAWLRPARPGILDAIDREIATVPARRYSYGEGLDRAGHASSPPTRGSIDTTRPPGLGAGTKHRPRSECERDLIPDCELDRWLRLDADPELWGVIDRNGFTVILDRLDYVRSTAPFTLTCPACFEVVDRVQRPA